MILICGIPSEAPLALAIAAAERGGLQHVVLNQRFAEHFDLAVDLRGGNLSGKLWANGREWPLEAFTGVYTRLMDQAPAAGGAARHGRPAADPNAAARADFLLETLKQWIEVANGRVLNRAAAMASNGSKPYQCQMIQRCGFPVPVTLVTNVPDEVLAFVALHRRIIYKSISSVRSIVREWKPEDRARLRDLVHLPTQFQAYVPGVNIRVHVVGETVFPTEIVSAAVDYRYGASEGFDTAMKPIELPGEIADRCRRLSAELDLPFCGIDLKRTPDGEYYCFEVNPSPAYSFFEENSGQQISRAVVDYLSGKKN